MLRKLLRAIGYKIRYWAGDVSRQSGRDSYAKLESSDAVQVDPRDVKAYFRRGMCRTKARRFRDAKLDFENVLKHDSKCAEGRYFLAHVLWQIGEYRRFESELEKLLELQPGYIYASNTRGFYKEAHEFKKECEEAVKTLDSLPQPPSGLGQSRPIRPRSRRR